MNSTKSKAIELKAQILAGGWKLPRDFTVAQRDELEDKFYQTLGSIFGWSASKAKAVFRMANCTGFEILTGHVKFAEEFAATEKIDQDWE